MRGRPFCLPCSLVDPELLAQVAQAAGDLMRESAIAARTSEAGDPGLSASDMASGAVDRVAHAAARERA